MNVNWLLTGFISIIGSIILSIIANLFTDPVKNWLAERSLINKRKRADQLRSDFEYVSSLFNDKNKLALQLGSLAFSALRGLGLSLLILSFMLLITSGLDASKSLAEIIYTSPKPGWEIARQIIFFILLILATYNGAEFYKSCTTSILLIRRIRHFDKYKKEATLQLVKLEKTVSVTKQ